MKLCFSAAYGTVAKGALACHLLCVPGKVSVRSRSNKSTSKKQKRNDVARSARERTAEKRLRINEALIPDKKTCRSK